MKRCGKCGTDNKDSSVFCLECGKPFEPRKRPDPEKAPAAVDSHKRPAGLYVAVGCIVVALLAGGVASLMIFGRDTAPEKNILQSADELIRGVTGAGGSDSSDASVEPVKRAIPRPAHSTGERVSAGSLALEVETSGLSAGEEIQKPAKGNRFLVVTLSVRNDGARASTVSSMLQMFALDRGGNEYDTCLYFPRPRFPDGVIQPGATASGKVAFEVPSGRKDFFFVLDPEVLKDGDEIAVKLY